MKGLQSGAYTPQFIHVLMGNPHDSPPGLISMPDEDEPQEEPSHTTKNFFTNDEFLEPLKAQRQFGDISAHVNRNQAQMDRQKIKSLEAELARCTHIQKECQQYQTIVENLKNRNRQLEKKLLEYQDKVKQVSAEKMALVRQQESSKKIVQSSLKLPTEDESTIKKKLLGQLCNSVEQYIKDRIAQFIETIKNERMTQRLESIIENFLEQLLQVNPFLIQNHLSKTASKTRSVINQSPKNILTLGNSRLGDSKFESHQKMQQKQSKFVLLQSSLKKPIADESFVVRTQDMSVRDTSMYGGYSAKDDRDRSKSQRRRRIFQ